MKKILSVLMSFCTLFFMPIGKVNAMETVNNAMPTVAQVIVFYEDEEKANEYIDRISKVVYDCSRNVILDKQNEFKYTYVKNVNGMLGKDICVKFLKFPMQNLQESFFGNKETNLYKALEESCQAILIYDINNPTLQPIINGMVSCDNWEELYRTVDTPLNKFIKYTQSFGLDGWHSSLEFLTYGIDDYEKSKHLYTELDSYTGFIEKEIFKYTTDNNKWNRGHGYFIERFKPTLSVISGEFFRFQKKNILSAKDINKNSTERPIPRDVQFYNIGRNNSSERTTGSDVLVKKTSNFSMLQKVGIGAGILAIVIGAGITIYKFFFCYDEKK